MWIPRLLKSSIEQAISSRPVVMVTGCRQAGKSSLLKHAFSHYSYVSFDDINEMAAARDNPRFYLNQLSQPVIIDEVQYVPQIMRELKVLVDENRQQYGTWLLTGSQQFAMMEQTSESLAGRIGLFHLETLSAKELRELKTFDLFQHLVVGGYPELWVNQRLNPKLFFDSYIRTYIERDLRAVIDVHDLSLFQKFLRYLCTRVGNLVNYTELSKSVGVADKTIKNWLHALQMTGVIYLLPPYANNIGKRLIKAPKLFFSDIGLLCHLLNIYDLQTWQIHPLVGSLWENFVFMEIVKTCHLRPGWDIFFYRDQNGVEIDFIVESQSKLSLIEAKASDHIDNIKLNFNKVKPLFSDYAVDCILAANIANERQLKLREFVALNPLLCDIKL